MTGVCFPFFCRCLVVCGIVWIWFLEFSKEKKPFEFTFSQHQQDVVEGWSFSNVLFASLLHFSSGKAHHSPPQASGSTSPTIKLQPALLLHTLLHSHSRPSRAKNEHVGMQFSQKGGLRGPVLVLSTTRGFVRRKWR